MKQKKYYYQELHACHGGMKRMLYGNLEVLKRVLKFLYDPVCLYIEIEKIK